MLDSTILKTNGPAQLKGQTNFKLLRCTNVIPVNESNLTNMNEITTVISIIVFLSACMGSTDEQKNYSDNKTHVIEAGENCYAFNNGKDSIKMSIEVNDNKARGALNFNYYEKDSNTGTFSGTLSGDTLWATYTFISEGVQSKREVVFLNQEDNWIQGYGNVTEKDGGFVFSDHDDISFDNNFVLEKIECNLK